MQILFKLNVMDLYFNDSPSRWKLWESGVYAYSPFTDEEEFRSKQEIEEQRRLVACGKL